MLNKCGFIDVRIEVKGDSEEYVKKWTPESHWNDGVEPKEYIATASIFAFKP